MASESEAQLAEKKPRDQEPVDENIAQSREGTLTPNSSENDPYEVTLDASEDPECFTTVRKWVIVSLISFSALTVTCCSSIAAFAENGSAEEFHVSKEVVILAISLYVFGLGLGPLLVGPLSEVYGRNIVYRVSFALLFIFSFPVAFAPNIEVFLIFRFITGFSGSAFMSVAGGSVSDLFAKKDVPNPMAVYTVSPLIGPVVGPLISGFINQHLNWRWTYRIYLVWCFATMVAVFVFVPETYVPVLRKQKAEKMRKSTDDEKYWAPLDRRETSISSAIVISCYRPFQLLLFDPMALLLNIWTSLVLGIVYLAFQAFPVIFEKQHGFNAQNTGLSFLGMGLGMLGAVPTQPYWNRVVARDGERNGGKVPPEALLRMGEVGAILSPLGLFWLAFTTYPSVPWPVPIIASIPFGTSIFYIFTCVFTYLVTAYRPIAASAMASNSALRSTFAAVFPLFAGPMYDKLGTVGATAMLAGIMTLTAPLPFVFRRVGKRLREKSRFAVD